MVDYIDCKESSGERMAVHLPSAMEASMADISCLSSGPPRFVSFIAQYRAKQMKEANSQTGETMGCI